MVGILNQEERDKLIPEVALFIAGRPDRLTPIIGYHITRIPTDPIPEQYAYQVVRYCELAAWVEDPALIIKLLNFWNNVVIFNNAINRIKTSAPPIYYKVPRVWDTCLLALDLPFLSREVTRSAIECFTYPLIATVNPAGIRVLVVKGPEKSGKSFTYDYIRYVNSIFANLNFKTIWIDFKKQVTSRFGPKELIENLLDQVNPNWKNDLSSMPDLNTQQPARWSLELVKFLVTQINNINITSGSMSKWYIILDGFDDTKVARDTIDLIRYIAAVATGSDLAAESNDVIRLVLLGFNENIPNFLNRVKVDDIKPVEKKDIEQYFTRYADVMNKSIEPAALNKLVDTVKIDEIENDKFRTMRIAQKVLNIVKTVFPK